MKAAVLILFGLVLVALLVFLGAQGRSLRRASVVNSVSELLSSERAFREHGVVTNSNGDFRAFSYTNAVMLGGTNFQCSLAVESDWIREYGFVALTTDGTVLWIDRELPPSITRTPDGDFSMPQRFR